MRRLLERLYDTSRYSSLVDRDRARLVYAIGSAMFVLLLVYLIVNRTAQGVTLLELAFTNATVRFYVGFFLVTNIASLMLTRSGRVNLASIGLIVMWIGSLGVTVIQGGLYSPTSGLTVVITLLLAGLLLSERGLILGMVLSMGMVIIGLLQRASVPRPETVNNTGDLVNYTMGLVVIACITYAFQRFGRLGRQEAVEHSRQDRLRLAEITSLVSQRISRRMALDEVLNNAVEQVRDSYPEIYHVQIFLVDDVRQTARLVASTGEVGRLLIERQHSLTVGSQSVIGQVCARGVPVVARASSGDGVHKRTEFLPETVVEAAFPLRIGSTIIGALDLQTKQYGAFHPDDEPIFQSLADHIAIAIDNARLFEETERRLKENQELVEQTRQAAEAVERLNQQLTGHFWQEYLERQPDDLGLNVEFGSRSVRDSQGWTPTLRQALIDNSLVQKKADGSQVIAVPLRVRGQVIGAMEFELDETGNLSPEDLNLIQEVGEQLGMAAETNRLFETSQRIAQREALVNEIATRLQASNNVEMTLNEAARSLKDTLRAQRVSIRLGLPTQHNGGKSNGGNRG